MEKKPKDLNYDAEMLESLGVLPFTLNKDTLSIEEGEEEPEEETPNDTETLF